MFTLNFFLGDASNFDDYEEEPRKSNGRKEGEEENCFSFSFLVRIATTEKFAKEFEEF